MTHTEDKVRRMEAVLRNLAEAVRINSPNGIAHLFDEVAAIVATLPKPVDADWVEAKAMTADEYPTAAPENEYALWKMAHLGIKRGRELAGAAHARKGEG